MKIEDMNQNNWGICGFVAAVQAANLNHKKGGVIAADTYATLFPLIENFCRNHADRSAALLDFSKVFGNVYAYRSLQDVTDKMRGNHAMDAQVGIAMTAAAVSLLCKDLGFLNYDFHATTASSNTLNLDKPLPYKNAIYGLGKKDNQSNYRYGLLHWVYVDLHGDVFTWGKKGADAIKALKDNGYDKLTHYLPALS
ncbi:hypothetical protein [Collimonas fungivorans]|uniref:Uncharacterized protein n=1 Tax=Collimonas fungivorans (strain Ter331) TaxID=1005048 RepID=G0A8I6_COLFT|nr:hypothetical protein [Collimonas fungivorans]AEK61459.1 hypothetical protein CFU_1627 [Collimonas fungivorans Ter331]